jgi:catechol 2,3-dioxygenase-like lactoylglutathione lyase family enzyme
VTWAGASLVGFVGVPDLDDAAGFYVDRLGLPLRNRDEFALELDGRGAPLRVTLVPDHVSSSATVVGWTVDDIDAAIDELVAAGVRFERYPWFQQDDRCVWVAPGGGRVAWFADPAGNVLSLTQRI